MISVEQNRVRNGFERLWCNSLSGNTLSILEMDAAIIPQAITVLNSLCFDCLTRFKTAGTHLNWTYISRVAVPPRDVLATIPIVRTRFSVEFGGAASIYDCPECFPELWAANKAVAQTYGLKAPDRCRTSSARFRSLAGSDRRSSSFYESGWPSGRPKKAESGS